MSNALNQLVQLLALKRAGENCFIGESQDLGLPQVFGGQVMAQALAAAMQVVGEERFLHSYHGYFLRAGSAQQPISYTAEILREGNSFTVVSVDATQNDELIFRLSASFHLDENGFEHQAETPEFPVQESLVSENQLIQQLAQNLPAPLKQLFSQERAFEVKLHYANNPFNGAALPPKQTIWVKPNGIVANDRRLQQCLLAYFADFHCIPTMLHPHECGVFQQKARFATLDHSMHIHRTFDFNQGLWLVLQSPVANGARGLTTGQVFSADGILVAGYRQEGLIRPL